MKKITTKVLTIVAACAAMVFASCAAPSTVNGGDDKNNGNGGSVLFEDAAGWSVDWEAKRFEASKFANVTNDTVISMEVSKDTDRLVNINNEGHEYDECYTLIQIMTYDCETKYGAGTATGATIENGIQLVKMFQDADPNTKFYTVTYKPTADEWTKIKAEGLAIQAHGTMFKKIELK